MIGIGDYTIIVKKANIGQNRHRWHEDDGKLLTLHYSNWSEVKNAMSMLKRDYNLKSGQDFIVSHGEEIRTGEPDLKTDNFQSTGCSWLHFDADKMTYELYGE